MKGLQTQKESVRDQLHSQLDTYANSINKTPSKNKRSLQFYYVDVVGKIADDDEDDENADGGISQPKTPKWNAGARRIRISWLWHPTTKRY